MRGRPNQSERLILDYARDKGEPIIDLQLDAKPLAAFARKRREAPVDLRGLAERMRAKGLLHTLERGRYLVNLDGLPSRRPLVETLDLLGEAVLRRLKDANHYLSWILRSWRHGLIDQQARTLVAVDRRKRDASAGPWRLRFITLSERHFFGWEEQHEGPTAIHLATVEKALLDSFYLPQHAAPFRVLLGMTPSLDQ